MSAVARPGTVETVAQTRLRSNAEIRLRNGSAPPSKGGILGCDALNALFRLASNPDTVEEGLKLLHELQTHQVELDLQYEQLEANEMESAEQIARYKTLYDFAPLGYFVVGSDACIIEANLAGAALFGIDQDDIGGRPVDSFLRSEGKLTLGWQLKQLFHDTSEVACYVRSDDGGDDSRHLQVIANLAPVKQVILMIISECESPSAA